VSARRLAPQLPRYKGLAWIRPALPLAAEDWSAGGYKSVAKDGDCAQILSASIAKLNANHGWRWPKRKQFFFSDLHAEADAFSASLVASGGVKKKGPGARDFVLTRDGAKANFIIGGDFFDKGTSNLELLRTVRHLARCGARVQLLAGNHDVRLLLGMTSVGPRRDVRNQHFFIRTGPKIIPLLREIRDEYLSKKPLPKGIPGNRECRRLLYPAQDWIDVFPKIAKGIVTPAQLQRELQRTAEKQKQFERRCAEAGLSFREAYAAVKKWQRLFLRPDGEFHWLFQRLGLAYRAGSFLFLHAGLDDACARDLHEGGVAALNRKFHRTIRKEPLAFYFGSLGNVLRTKYRKSDRAFSKSGAREIRRAGFSAIVHGHRNLRHGQRLAGRRTMLNFECDSSLDTLTRSRERIAGAGAAVTIVDPHGFVLGISSDYPRIKVFEPKTTAAALNSRA